MIKKQVILTDVVFNELTKNERDFLSQLASQHNLSNLSKKELMEKLKINPRPLEKKVEALKSKGFIEVIKVGREVVGYKILKGVK